LLALQSDFQGRLMAQFEAAEKLGVQDPAPGFGHVRRIVDCLQDQLLWR
jgi:hypothetical protein